MINNKPVRNGIRLSEEDVKSAIETKLVRFFGVTPEEANDVQVYKSTVLSVRDILNQKRTEFRERVKVNQGKRVYYLCMEFLVGRGLKTNLMNLGIADQYDKCP